MAINDSFMAVGNYEILDKRCRGFKFDTIPYEEYVYLYKWTKGKWAHTQTLVAPDTSHFQGYGSKLAMSNNFLFVSERYAKGDSTGKWYGGGNGKVVVYKQDTGVWSLHQILHVDSFFNYANFGFDLDASDSNLAVSAPYDTTWGSVYTYRLRSNGNWEFLERLSPNRGRFGIQVEVSGNDLLVHERKGYTDRVDCVQNLLDTGYINCFSFVKGKWELTQTIAQYLPFFLEIEFDEDKFTLLSSDYQSQFYMDVFTKDATGQWVNTLVIEKAKNDSLNILPGMLTHNDYLLMARSRPGWDSTSGGSPEVISVFGLFDDTYLHLVDLDIPLSAQGYYRLGYRRKSLLVSSPYFYHADSGYVDDGKGMVLSGSFESMPTFSTQYISKCDSFHSPSGKYVWGTSGRYMDTLVNADGFDSLILVYYHKDPEHDSLSITSCRGYTSPSGKFWDSSGTYLDTLRKLGGCDSIRFHISLIVDHSTPKFIRDTFCEPGVSPSLTKIIRQLGWNYDTIRNALGCDSLLYEIFLARDTTYKTIFYTDTVCGSFMLPVSKRIITQSGTYLDFAKDWQGCDSVLHFFRLTVIPVTNSTVIDSSCEPQHSIGGSLMDQSGVYRDTLFYQDGCDSIVFTTYFNLVSIDTALVVDATGLQANEDSATYQWFNCANGLHIDSATQRKFSPTSDGSYAVVLYKSDCTDTSSCVLYKTGGFQNINNTGVLYPNPTSGIIHITTNHLAMRQINVIGCRGELIFSQMAKGSTATVQLPAVSGIYVVQVELSNGFIWREKVVRD